MDATEIVGLACPKCGQDRDMRSRLMGRRTCFRHEKFDGSTPANPKVRRFKAAMVSPWKRLVQRELYRLAAARIGVAPRVLILPGQRPSTEIRCIRRNMPGAHVTALDRDPVAVRAAAAAGADHTIYGELSNIDKATAPEYIAGDFDLVNADLCGNVPGTNRWHRPAAWCDSPVTRASRHARKLFAVFVACSHEEFDALITPRIEIDRFARQHRSQIDTLPEMPSTVRERLLALWSQVWENGFTPARVYRYRSGVSMIAALFARNGWQHAPFYSDHGYRNFEIK